MSLTARQRLALLAIAALASLFALSAGVVALPFIAALLLALLLDPVTTRLIGWGTAPALAAALTAGLTTVVTAAVVFGALPFLARDARELVRTVATNAGDIADRLGALWARWLPAAEPLHEALRSRIESLASSSAGAVAPALEGLASLGGAVATTLLFVVLVPVALFFFLKDGRRLRDRAVALLPRPYQGSGAELLAAIGDGLGGYLRGQGLVCAAQALFHAIGLSLIGLDFGILIGVLTGLGALVPIVANAVMLAVALLVAAVQFDSLLPVLAVLALYGTAQVLETLVLVPALVGTQIAVHPLLMILAVIMGGRLFGLVGALLALPGTTVLVVTARWFWQRYRASAVYLSTDGDVDPTAPGARDVPPAGPIGPREAAIPGRPEVDRRSL